MGTISLAYGANKRTGLPEAITLNCFSEQTPTKQSAPLALLARPGLALFEEVGTAPIRGVFAKSGLIGDAFFIVANTTAYLVTATGMVTALVGVIPGDDLVEIDGGLDADYNSIIRVATGTSLHKFDSSTTTVLNEGLAATSVAFWAGYWLYTEAGSDAVYRQEPASTTWSPIDFASAEYAPDPNKGVRVFGDLAALLGAATTEFWALTGDSGSPMGPAGGLKFDRGCRNIAAAVNCAGTLIWVDDKCAVQLSEGGPPRIVSDNGLAEQIRRCAAVDLSASFFEIDQHPFYVLNLGTAATWAYDLSTNRPVRFSSLNQDSWRARLFATVGETTIAADRASSQLFQLDPDRRTDGDDVFTVGFTGFIDIPEGELDLANIELDCLTGAAPLTGQGSDPVILMRVSHDEGASWGGWKERPLGKYGQNAITPRWNALGTARGPKGALVEWQVSDPVGRRFSAARYNTP